MGIIAISRGSFSGGKAVAEQLGTRLGYPVLSREQVLRQAAQDYGISAEELLNSLNQAPPFWQQVLGKRVAYVKCVTAVLLDQARAGHLIYHGHVGHLLLAGITHVLRVRVIADWEQRVQSAMSQAHFTRDQAIAHIERVDKERSKWAQVLYGVNWDDPAQYDLILNLERLSIATAGEMIAQLAAARDFQPTEASLRIQQNLSLSARVWAAMARNPITRSAGLEVTADDGAVTIKGNVGSRKVLDAITETASQVDGLKKLECEAGIGTSWHW